MGLSLANLPSRRKKLASVFRKRKHFITIFSYFLVLSKLKVSTEFMPARASISFPNHDAVVASFRRLHPSYRVWKRTSPQNKLRSLSPVADRLRRHLSNPIEWVLATEATAKALPGLILIPRAIPTFTDETKSQQISPKKPSSEEPILTGEPSDPLANISRTWLEPSLLTTGISRPGLTCYRRSSLQLLLHAPIFVNWLLRHDSGNPNDLVAPDPFHHCRAKNSRTGCLACKLKALAAAYWQNPRNQSQINRAASALDDLIAVLGGQTSCKLDTPDIGVQGDPMEFIVWIEEYFHNFNPLPMPLEQTRALFYLEYRVRRVCEECGTKESPGRPDPRFFLAMGLGVVRGAPFKRHLEKVLNDQGTEGQCARCQSKHQMPEQMRIRKAPEILFVQFERNFESATKIRDVVDFPEMLDLTEYMDDDYEEASGRRPEKLRYELNGAISHRGPLGGGHYISTTKSTSGVFEANDLAVRRGDFRKMASQRLPFDTVVLMYFKK